MPLDEPANLPVFNQKQVPTKQNSTLHPKTADEDLPITITQKELLSLAPAVQSQLLALVKDKPFADSASSSDAALSSRQLSQRQQLH